MSNRYTAYHYNGSQIHLFPTDSIQEAHQYLLHQTESGLTTPKSVLVIMEGADDQIIYFKKSVTLLAQLKAHITTQIRGYFGQGAIHSIKKWALTSLVIAD